MQVKVPALVQIFHFFRRGAGDDVYPDVYPGVSTGIFASSATNFTAVPLTDAEGLLPAFSLSFFRPQFLFYFLDARQAGFYFPGQGVCQFIF